jgi:hypothetical protein
VREYNYELAIASMEDDGLVREPNFPISKIGHKAVMAPTVGGTPLQIDEMSAKEKAAIETLQYMLDEQRYIGEGGYAL